MKWTRDVCLRFITFVIPGVPQFLIYESNYTRNQNIRCHRDEDLYKMELHTELVNKSNMFSVLFMCNELLRKIIYICPCLYALHAVLTFSVSSSIVRARARARVCVWNEGILNLRSTQSGVRFTVCIQ
jgi:hypothetical protein